MMENQMRTAEDSRFRMREWYVKNSERTKTQRNEEYQENPDIRELKIRRAREYRERRKAGGKVERVYHREINGHHVQVYSLGYVADQAGTYSQMLINFEKRGWIPKPIFKENHRLYTAEQMKLIVEAVELHNTLANNESIPRNALKYTMRDNCAKLQKGWA